MGWTISMASFGNWNLLLVTLLIKPNPKKGIERTFWAHISCVDSFLAKWEGPFFITLMYEIDTGSFIILRPSVMSTQTSIYNFRKKLSSISGQYNCQQWTSSPYFQCNYPHCYRNGSVLVQRMSLLHASSDVPTVGDGKFLSATMHEDSFLKQGIPKISLFFKSQPWSSQVVNRYSNYCKINIFVLIWSLGPEGWMPLV